ncbi:MAG: siphovirus Gp157 family protein [Bdellovibrionaceae bacterium]|nr:siphovirus Gp157 family protein [Pseudobdellovibrionaceae bacterium]
MSEENKSLVVIVNEAMSLERMLIESGGEVSESIEKMLAVNSNELAVKVDGYHEIIERFESLSDHYKRRAEFYSKIASQCDNAASRLENNIKFAMQELQVDEIKGVDMRFKLSATSGALKINDAEMVPVEFKSEKIETVIDKKAVKDALSNGKEVPGAELVPGSSLRVYANTPEKKSKKKEVV